MTQLKQAETFSHLHQPGNPLVLYNAWDAGSANAMVAAGASAVATGSWSVASAQGYDDGEAIELDLLVRIVERIVATIHVPVSVDFEGAYSTDPTQAAANVERLMTVGAVGINFEDQVIGGSGLHDVDEQCARIAAIRDVARRAGIPLFINARTDIFLQAPPEQSHAQLIGEATHRAKAYANAGASGMFVPWLKDLNLIRDFCTACPLPVNIMMRDGAPSAQALASAGVARISHGPGPYRRMVEQLEQAAQAVYGSL
ncbi:MAG: isocitrate lyase/phosphoenolpyruvate mutase family protein [Gammaproteobacteria bacterium]